MTMSCQVFEKFGDKVKWKSVMHRYRLSPDDSVLVNTDTRLGFKLKNQFLVKSIFTFFLRTMNHFTAHLIQTLNAPLAMFFVPNALGEWNALSKKYFLSTRFIYIKKLFLAIEAYRITSDNKYCLFFTQVNFFSLDMVDETLENTLQIHKSHPNRRN